METHVKSMVRRPVWPKTPPALTPAQEHAREQFMQLWHEVLPKRYSIIEQFNHGWVARLPHQNGSRTLEIGAGIGAHVSFEDIADQEYYCLELRESFCQQLRANPVFKRVLCEDIQNGTSFPSAFFDRIIAIHVLEHLRALPDAISEMLRLLKPNGILDVVLPCEGGAAYALARKISAERLFEKNFHMSYTPIIRNEHVNTYKEVLHELQQYFWIESSQYFPLRIPAVDLNLCVGLRLKRRAL